MKVRASEFDRVLVIEGGGAKGAYSFGCMQALKVGGEGRSAGSSDAVRAARIAVVLMTREGAFGA